MNFSSADLNTCEKVLTLLAQEPRSAGQTATILGMCIAMVVKHSQMDRKDIPTLQTQCFLLLESMQEKGVEYKTSPGDSN